MIIVTVSAGRSAFRIGGLHGEGMVSGIKAIRPGRNEEKKLEQAKNGT